MQVVTKIYTKKLRELANYVKKFFADFRPIWKGPSGIVKDAVKKIIDDGDSSWKPLTKATLKWRSDKGYASSPTLKASGRLQQSFGDIEKSEKKTLTLGTNVPYAAVQQVGSSLAKFGAIPARPFAIVSESTQDKISENVTDQLSAEITKIINKTKEDDGQ